MPRPSGLSGSHLALHRKADALGVLEPLITVRESFKLAGYSIAAAWSMAEREIFPDGPWMTPEPKGEKLSKHAKRDDRLPDLALQDLMRRIPLEDAPADHVDPLTTLRWVCCELGKRDPEATAKRSAFLAWRRHALNRAPSYEARWLLTAAGDDPKVESDLRSAWKATLPNRKDLDRTERLMDDGRKHIGFIEKCRAGYRPLFDHPSEGGVEETGGVA